MIIKEVLAELETKQNPVAKALHKNDHFKVLVMAFKNGMILKEHKAHLPTILTVLEGSVAYINDSEKTMLSKYDSFQIPVNELHSVEAFEDSICLLTQG